MNRLGALITLLMFVLLPWSLASSEEALSFETEAQRQLYLQLTAELRCPQCQNQNIADSNAVVSVDMRQKTYQMIMQGSNRSEVLDYMINRYGNFVHYQPPLNRYTVLLWLAPVLLLVALIVLQLKRRAGQSNVEVQPEAGVSIDAELDKLIDQYRSKK